MSYLKIKFGGSNMIAKIFITLSLLLLMGCYGNEESSKAEQTIDNVLAETVTISKKVKKKNKGKGLFV